MGMLSGVAGILGISEPAIRLTAAVFGGYPLSLVYRKWFIKQPAWTQHVFFTLTGGFFIFLNYGWDVYHSVLSILVAYLLCRFIGNSIYAVIISFVFQMLHLLIGYYVTESADYDITWTMPQCILALRLIGLSWDYYDGHKPKEEVTKEQEETAIPDCPDLLEIFAYCYFYGGFLVGPQFPLTRFRKFVNGDFLDKETGGAPDSVFPCLHRLGLGILWLLLHVFGATFFPSDFFLTPQYFELGYASRWLHNFLWYKTVLFRYIGAWLVNEGVCILSGLSHDGVGSDGKVRWNGLRNIKMRLFFFGPNFQSVVESFNLNTNKWAARYVFKRLKFLNNKTVSHVSTLFFLAIWHGFHLGYFACFAFEFLCVIAERQLIVVIHRLPAVEDFLYNTPTGKVISWVFGKTMNFLGCTYGFIPFGQIKKERWFPIYRSLWFGGWIALCLLWPILFQILLRTLPKPKKKEDKKEE